MSKSLTALFSRTWIWSFIAAASVFLVTIIFTGGASTIGLAQAALTFGAFSVLVGLGQMLVITLGPGNIDLSVPANMTLAATVSLKVMNVENSMILTGCWLPWASGLRSGSAIMR
jgi:ribose transport system permease protein